MPWGTTKYFISSRSTDRHVWYSNTSCAGPLEKFSASHILFFQTRKQGKQEGGLRCITMAWTFAIVEIICVLLSKVQQKEKSGGLGKAPMKIAFGFANFFLLCFVFQKLSHLKEGSCLATKRNCHLSQPEVLELKMSVGRGGGERRVQPFLSWKIVYLNSPPKPQGKVAAMYTETVFIPPANIAQKWPLHKVLYSFLEGVPLWLSHPRCNWMGTIW